MVPGPLRCPLRHLLPAAAAGPGPARCHGGPGARPRRDLYELLGVPATATQAQIKAAYYEQCLRCHPDRHGGSAEAARRFAAVREAYAVLGSAARRRLYDRSAPRPPAAASAAARPAPAAAAARPAPPAFDFDAFYRAHYGEQLERERALRERRLQLRRRREQALRRGGAAPDVSLGLLLLLLGAALLHGLK
ncbi:dnaJ homolog subfamily C member 30, mitochondrial [Eudromia elegans]